jgi:hypothetical protein
MQEDAPRAPILRSLRLATPAPQEIASARDSPSTERTEKLCAAFLDSLMLGKGALMQNSGLPKLIYSLLVAAGLLYFSFLYPQLPDPMASHFNASGVAPARMPKSGFFFLFALVMVFTSMPVFLVPWQIATKSNDKINLPNKEYWLAPERRSETMRYLAIQVGWFGCALLAMLLCGFYFAVSANLKADHNFDSSSFYVAFAAFLVFCLSLPVRLISHFRNVS